MPPEDNPRDDEEPDDSTWECCPECGAHTCDAHDSNCSLAGLDDEDD